MIAAPAAESVANAQLFVAQLDRIRIQLRGVVVNRIQLWPGGGPPTGALLDGSCLDREVDLLAAALGDPPDREAARAILSATREQAARVRDDFESSRSLRDRARELGCFFKQVPELPQDVHDLAGLAKLARAIASAGVVAKT